MPTSASSVRPSTSGEQVGAAGRTSPGRSPCAPSRARAGPARRAARSRPCSARAKSSSTATGCRSGVERVRAAGEQLVRRALDEAADDVACRPRPSSRWNVAISLYSASNGSSATRGYAARVAAGSRPPFSASTTSAPSVGSPISSPSRDDRVRREQHRQQELLERARPAAGDALDRPLGRVAAAGDRVAPAGDRQLDGGHLVQRQRAGLVGVDRRRRAERLGRAQPLHDRVRLARASACPSRGSSSRPPAARSGSPRPRRRWPR